MRSGSPTGEREYSLEPYFDSRDRLAGIRGGDPTGGEQVLLALAVILLIIAVVGGIAIHPLLFLIAILAVLAFFAGRL